MSLTDKSGGIRLGTKINQYLFYPSFEIQLRFGFVDPIGAWSVSSLTSAFGMVPSWAFLGIDEELLPTKNMSNIFNKKQTHSMLIYCLFLVHRWDLYPVVVYKLLMKLIINQLSNRLNQ